MAINTASYAALFQTNLDKLIAAVATSTFLEANQEQIQYNGGKTIKIADIAISGLQDYDRATGFKGGDITLSWTDYTLSQDRGVTFQIDRMDNDETMGLASASTVIAEFGRTKVVPEVDAYRYATLAEKARTSDNGEVVNAPAAAALTKGDDLVAAIDKAIVALKEAGVEKSGLVLVSTPTNIGLAGESQKWQRLTNTTIIPAGTVGAGTVKTYDEVPIIEATSDRFKLGFTKGTGTAGGFSLTGAPINFILATKTGAAVAIVKTDKVRIFEPDTNQTADAWKIDVRVYHDIIIPKNKKKAIYAHIGA